MIDFNLLLVLAIVMVVEVVKPGLKLAFPDADLTLVWVALPTVLGVGAGFTLAWGEAWNVIALTSFVHAAAAGYGYKFARELLLKQIQKQLGG